MPEPLLFLSGAMSREKNRLRRVRVPVPTPADSSDAIFLMMRRLRGPLITLVVIFAISVVGLTLVPGLDAAGRPYRMSLFDAFYVMSYTATTIGFGEIPTTFTSAQRMWMTFSIYLTVTGWAYSIGTVFALLNDSAFRRAISQQRFRTKVKHLREPFYLIAGYGQAGRALSAALDRAGQRVVVLDEDPARIDILATDQFLADVPALTADPRNPAVLGLAGLGHRQLRGVMAMTDKDEQNLAVVIAAHLLRPEVPVITRCTDRTWLGRFDDFQPEAVINPFDRYGSYLVLALNNPVTHRLASWLLQTPGSSLPPHHDRLREGHWVVCADGEFGREVARDLRSAGLEVTVTDPAEGQPDVSDAVGLVAGAESDTVNLSVAAGARLENPDIYLSVRQKSIHTTALMESFAPESVFVATDLVAFEALARVEAPKFWNFIEHVMSQDDAWSDRVLKALIGRVGGRTPTAELITLDEHEAPAVVRWLDHGHTLTIGQLLSDPDDNTVGIQVFPTELIRDGETTFVPDLDTELRHGDQLALLVRTHGMAELRSTLSGDGAVEYVATGNEVPSTWIGRAIAHRKGLIAD